MAPPKAALANGGREIPARRALLKAPNKHLFSDKFQSIKEFLGADVQSYHFERGRRSESGKGRCLFSASLAVKSFFKNCRYNGIRRAKVLKN